MSVTPDKIRAQDIKPFWRPKGQPVKEQCVSCPFGPNAHLLNDHEEATAAAIQSARMGLDFYCHKTVYKGALKVPKPVMKPKSQWRVCAGMVAYKQNMEIEMRKKVLREQGRLIE